MSFQNPYAAYKKQAQLMKKMTPVLSSTPVTSTVKEPEITQAQQEARIAETIEPARPEDQSPVSPVLNQYQAPVKTQPATLNAQINQLKHRIEQQKISQQLSEPYQKPVQTQQHNILKDIEQPLQPSKPPKMSPKAVNQLQPQSPAQQGSNNYFTNSIMTATPEELVLLLYQGALKFMKQTISQMEAKNIAEANRFNQRAQAIFEELMCTLDMNKEVSHQLFNLYRFILDSLVEANIKQDPVLVSKMIEFTLELRNTWQEAMKLAKQEKAI